MTTGAVRRLHPFLITQHVFLTYIQGDTSCSGKC